VTSPRFDQSFIHRNVITGQKLERPNSKNMTSFILGEDDTALLATLEKDSINRITHLIKFNLCANRTENITSLDFVGVLNSGCDLPTVKL
jgi:hypothetical protein